MSPAPNAVNRHRRLACRLQYLAIALAMAVMADTPAGADEHADALAGRVVGGCVAAGDPPESCRCMVEGLSDRLSTEDARRFFLLTLDEPATGLPMLSLDEVDAFTARLEAAIAAVGPACNP